MARPKDRVASHTPSLAEDVFAEMKGPNRITSTHGGSLDWTLANQGLIFYDGRGEVDVHGPRASIPVKDGGTIEVEGLLGFFEQESEDISLHGNVGVSQHKGGRVEWNITAENAYYRRRAEAFELDGLVGRLTPKNGDSVDISGGLGRYDIRKKLMTLDQDVRCRFKDGVTLATSHLDYNVASETAATRAEVDVQGKGFWLRSTGLDADLKTRRIVAPANVRLKLDPKKAKPGETKPGRTQGRAR